MAARKTAELFENWRDRRLRGVKEPGPVGRFVETYKKAFRIGGLAVAIIVLLAWSGLTAGAVIGTFVVLLVSLVIVELLRGVKPPEEKERYPYDAGDKEEDPSRDD
ncbi:MAG: hypothetical protein SWK76_13890 [Actinomycetota bacterium]|nr:hypothetical protein [Actinomycetota bacterium]